MDACAHRVGGSVDRRDDPGLRLGRLRADPPVRSVCGEPRRVGLALINSRHTIEDEERTEPDNDRLLVERHALLDQIEAAPDLSTRADAATMARAALADAPLGRGGHWEATEDCDWLALTVAEYLVREGAA
jgi:hypothetical protein